MYNNKLLIMYNNKVITNPSGARSRMCIDGRGCSVLSFIDVIVSLTSLFITVLFNGLCHLLFSVSLKPIIAYRTH